MGCCQSSTADQAHLDFSRENLNSPEAHHAIPILQIPDIHLLKLENFSSVQTSPDRSYCTLDCKIVSNSSFSRFTCTFGKSSQPKEALIIRKGSMFINDYENLVENTGKLTHFSSENIVKVYYISQDKDFIKIITEPCGVYSLEELIENSTVSVVSALSFFKELVKATSQYHRLGITLKHLTEKDVFLISSTLKISISAGVIKINEFEAPDFENSPKNDVWNLGVILLKLLFAPHEINTVQDALDRLDSLGLPEADKRQISSLFKPLFHRPALAEVANFQWSVESDSTKQTYLIEKITEELSENLSLDEPQSPELEKSEASSSEFYKSEDLADKENEEKSRNPEIFQNEAGEIKENPDYKKSFLENESIYSNENKAKIIISEIVEFPEGSLPGHLPLSLSKTPEPQLRKELSGIVKFFSFKQRSGLIHCDETNEDYPITQYDLVLSNPNLSQLTKHLLSGCEIQVKFSLIPGTEHLGKISYN